MPIGTGRTLHSQQVHYFRKRVNFNDAGIASQRQTLLLKQATREIVHIKLQWLQSLQAQQYLYFAGL